MPINIVQRQLEHVIFFWILHRNKYWGGDVTIYGKVKTSGRRLHGFSYQKVSVDYIVSEFTCTQVCSNLTSIIKLIQ